MTFKEGARNQILDFHDPVRTKNQKSTPEPTDLWKFMILKAPELEKHDF